MDQHQRELIAHLEGHPSWQALVALAKEKREHHLARITARIVAGDLSADDVRDTRAFLLGMDTLLKAPKGFLEELD